MRVPYDDIQYTNQDLYVYDGKLFTGVGFEEDAEGNLTCEIYFKEGKQHGPARDFYPSGNLNSEMIYIDGIRHGASQEWDENGRLRERKEFEYDVLMRRIGWSESGQVIEDFTRDPDDILAKLVLARRGQ